jgi:hypothetical protein
MSIVWACIRSHARTRYVYEQQRACIAVHLRGKLGHRTEGTAV